MSTPANIFPPEVLDALVDEIAARVAVRLDPERVLSASEAAAFLGMDYKALLAYRRAGGLPSIKLGKAYGFRRDDLIRFRDSHTKVVTMKMKG